MNEMEVEYSDWNAAGSNLQLDIESHQYLISVLLLILQLICSRVFLYQKPLEGGVACEGVLKDVRPKQALAHE